MKHDFPSDCDSDSAQAFINWLESETVSARRRGRNNADAESLKASVFLYVNRAYEAGLPDNVVGGTFGRCIARAGYTEEEQDSVFDLLESLADVDRAVHNAG